MPFDEERKPKIDYDAVNDGKQENDVPAKPAKKEDTEKSKRR